MHRTALVLAVALLSGCADGQDAEIRQTVAAFGDALRSDDTTTACELLAPLTQEELESSEDRACPEALAAQDLPRPAGLRSIDRFGREAQVVMESPSGGSDTWFLSRFDGRWLVVASGCRPRGEELPYDCDVEGP